MIENSSQLISEANEKIEFGKDLIDKLQIYAKVDGVPRLQRRISKEIKFLEKMKQTNKLKENHVTCSNLTHFGFFVEVLLKQENVTHVDFPVRMSDNSLLRVDIVCNGGSKWVKVIARNTNSLNNAARGEAHYGAKSVLDQAKNFVLAASNNPCMFKTPQVVFEFLHDMDEEVFQQMENEGIEIVSGGIKRAAPKYTIAEVTALNLDITSLIAYVSSLTNDDCKWIFKEQILTDQARQEARNPVKPILDNLFNGKKLLCCETAVSSFKDIINLLAGPNEKQRSAELLSRVQVLPDVDVIPVQLESLKIGGKIKERSLKIFAFGISNKAITVTSNEGFVRSAKSQQIEVPVFLHDARALTEIKQSDAIHIDC